MLVSRYGELSMKKKKGRVAPLQRMFFVLSVLLAAVFAPFGGKVQAAVADHIITDTVDPDGITINLFDYWLKRRTRTDRPVQETAISGSIRITV